MAKMFPESLDGLDPTPGERTFFEFLRDRVKPDDDCRAWYNPVVPRRGLREEPDFLIWLPEVGLIVVEVKDWRLDSVKSAGHDRFILDFGGGEISKDNPMRQARDYYRGVKELLEGDRRGGGLKQTRGRFMGGLRFPVVPGVFFAQIASSEILGGAEGFRSDWERICPPKTTIYRD